MADRDLKLALLISAEDVGASRTVKGISKDVEGLTTKLRQLAAVAGTAFGGREVIRAADEYATLTARILTATETQEEYNLARAELFEISQRTRADLSATVDLFQKTNSTLREIGATEQQRLGFIEAVNQALAISGAKGPQAAAAILQLSQGLGSGALRGEEFNSVFEASRGLMQAFADGLGVPIGKMRQLAEAGELTTERLFAALLSQKEKLAQQYSVFPETVEGALQRVQNAFTKYIGERNGDTGGSRALAQALTSLAENFGTLADAAVLTGGVIASVYAGRVAAALVVHGKAMAGTITQAIAARQAAMALAVAEQGAAAAALNQARAQQVAATAALAEANANRANVAQMVIYGATRAAAERQVTAAAAAHVAATNAMAAADARLVAASNAVAAAQSRSALTSRGLGAAVGFLGGPIGVVTTLLTAGALAWLVWGDRAESAAEKAKRATKEVADQANDILERLRKTDTFGGGDLGILRERASLLEKEISLLARSSGQSPEAAAALKDKRAALVEVTEAISKLATQEKAQAEQFSRLANGQALDAKKLGKDFKEGIEDQIKGYQELAKTARQAWQQSADAERDFRAQAAKLRAEATTATRGSGVEDQAMAMLDLLAAEEKLRSLRGQGSNLDDVQRQSDLVQQLAGQLTDQARAQEAVKNAKLAEADAFEKAAEQQKLQQAGLIEQQKNAELVVKDLQAALDSLGKGTALKIDSVQAKAVLEEITKSLDALKDKTITIKVKQEGGLPLDNLSQGVKGFATGGLLMGPGHATSDNILLLGSPGEYMLKAAAVKHYGLPLIEALNNLRLPRFASGGLVDRMQRLPDVPRSLNQPFAAQVPKSMGTVNVNFDLGSLGRFEMQSAPDVAKGLQDALRSAALQAGGRR